MAQIIKQNWESLDAPLQSHILACLQERLEVRYADIQASAILGESLRSPIGMSHPKIPVRLPTGPDVIYDLEELLQLMLINQKNPMNRDAFTLKGILPAPEALQKLLQRLSQAASKDLEGEVESSSR